MLMKHPATRVRSFLDIEKDFLQGLIDDCFEFISLTPFADLVIDLQGDGSYARECAELHSDMDINIAFASEADRLLARRRIKENPEQWAKAVAFLNQLRVKYGLFIEPALQHDNLANTPKSYFSFKEKKLYKGETRKIDIDYYTKEVKVRPVDPSKPKHMSIGVIGDDGNAREFDPNKDSHDVYDQWIHLVPEYEAKLKDKFLRFGETEETAYMKKL